MFSFQAVQLHLARFLFKAHAVVKFHWQKQVTFKLKFLICSAKSLMFNHKFLRGHVLSSTTVK